jgi:hypothetical protein
MHGDDDQTAENRPLEEDDLEAMNGGIYLEPNSLNAPVIDTSR